MTKDSLALETTQIWDLVPSPASDSITGSKLVHSIKLDYDGRIDTDKACLVAQGFKQEYGIKYEETFAPISNMTRVRTLLGVAAICN